jgi:hypothetical protein
MGGLTYDYKLTDNYEFGSYIALNSISVSGKIYWAKVIKSK